MLAEAAAFWQLILAVHILAVIVAFGVTFTYPLFLVAGARLDPRAMPWFHRMQQMIGRRVINPALTVVLLTGIYLASHLHQWHSFYVAWGLAATVVLGGIEGVVMIRGEGRLAAVAARDVAASGADAVSWSPEYEAQFKRLGAFGALQSLIVAVTVFLMSVQA